MSQNVKAAFRPPQEVYEQLRNIDFLSSFTDESDPFDPADMEGILVSGGLILHSTPQRAHGNVKRVLSPQKESVAAEKKTRPVFMAPKTLQNGLENGVVSQEESKEAEMFNKSCLKVEQSVHLSKKLSPSSKILPQCLSPSRSLSHTTPDCSVTPRKQPTSPENSNPPFWPHSSPVSGSILPQPSPLREKNPFNQTRNIHTSNAALIRSYPTLQLATQANLGGAAKNVRPIILSNEQEYVLQLAKQGCSLFFTGSAGTGKSVLLKSIIKVFKQQFLPGEVAVTASTGLAACNIGGITVHSFAGVGLGDGDAHKLIKKVRTNKKARVRWQTTKVLVIDEISMIDGKFFDKLDTIARSLRRNQSHLPFGGIQLVICGDFYQLPPVSKTINHPDGTEQRDDAVFAFESESWARAVRSTIILKEVFRQKGDQKFIDMLNGMRNGFVDDEAVAEFTRLGRRLECPEGIVPTELYSTRMEVDYANNSKLRNIRGNAMKYEANDLGTLPAPFLMKTLANFLAPQTLFLKKGAQVMCIKNFDETLVNGSLGRVVDFMDRDTYMFHTAMEESPEATLEEIRQLLKPKKDKGEHQQKPDNVFDFLEEIPDKAALILSGNEASAFTSNKDRKSEYFRLLRETSLGQKYPVVRFMLPDGVNTRDVLVEPEKWVVEEEQGNEHVILAQRQQLPLMLAWALSIHKSQGQTLSKVVVNLSRVFETGQAYVALSRAVSRDGLQVLNFRKERVSVHAKVEAFYKTLSTSEELARVPTGGQQRLPFVREVEAERTTYNPFE